MYTILTLTAFGTISSQTNFITSKDSLRIPEYLGRARQFSIKNQFDSSIYYDKLLVSIYLSNKDTSKASRMENFIAKMFLKKFEFDSAFFYIHKALQLFPENSLKPALEKGELFNTLGAIYFGLGDYANAVIYYTEALTVRSIHFAPNNRLIADSYTNLGNAQYGLGHYDDAIHYYILALENRLSQKEINTISTAKNYNNIGFTYLQQNKFNEAKNYFVKGFAYAPLAVLYNNLGRIYTREKNIFAADTSLKKALAIRKERLGLKHFLTAESYNALGELRKIEGKQEQALDYYSAALNSSIQSNEENFFGNSKVRLHEIISVKDFFIALNGKAEMLAALAKKDSAVYRLTYAKRLLSYCIPLLSALQHHYEFDESKLRLRNLSDQTMNLGVEVCWELYLKTKDEKYFEEAFLFSETKRNSVLNETKQKRAALSKMDVPDSIRNLQHVLKLKVQRLFISTEESQVEESDNKTFTRDNQLLNAIQAYDSLLSNIEQNYPNYASLISTDKVIALEDLKKGLATEDVWIEYTLTEKSMYIFLLTSESFSLIKKKKAPLFDKWNYDFTSSIKKIERKSYENSARALYKQLITPIEKALIRKSNVTVVPCSELASLPFEALISPGGFPFVQSVNIRYLGSSRSIERDSLRQKDNFPFFFIGFAPSYTNQKDFASLKNEEEVKEIAKELRPLGLRDTLYVGKNTTKQNFFSCINKSKILHIAAHSYADTMNEGLNGIILSSDSRKEDSETLTGSEIISSEITNDLIVLSSCESGNGKTAGGEGVLSLARSFIKAGAHNLLVALWRVPDEQTRMFMIEFYKQLIKDDNYAKALARTKRTFIKRKQFAFPQTWGAFVLMK